MERTLSTGETDALLQSEVFGSLGCADGSRPYVLPLAYVYHENVIYGQTTEGKKTDILRRNPSVCFQVQRQGEGEWRSAMCWGTFEELDFEKLEKGEAAQIVALLTKRLSGIQKNVGIVIPFSFADGAAPLTLNSKKSTLFRILVTEKTGRLFS